MRKRKYLLAPLAFLTLLAAQAQEVPVHHFGYPRVADQMADACRSYDGGVIACGSGVSPDDQGDWDGILIKISHRGEQVFRKRLGVRARHEHALAVAEDNEGRIWVGGYADSANVVRAWLKCQNPDGERIWERPLYVVYAPSTASVQDMLPGSDGRQMAVAGVAGGRAWFGLWKMNGEKVFEPKKIERLDGRNDVTVEKVVLVQGRQSWFLYGHGQTPDKKRQVFAVKLDAASDPVASILWSDTKDQLLGTGGCVLTTGGNLLGVGTAEVIGRQEEAFTLYIPSDFDRQQVIYGTFGGRNESRFGRRLDEAADIAVLDAQTCLVTGTTQSHAPGAQVTNFATWRVDHYGKRIKDMADYGGELAERGVKSLVMYSGDVWLCGVQNAGNSVREDPDFAFARMESLALPFAGAAQKGAVALRAPEAAPGVLPGGVTAVAVEVVNQAATPVEGMYIAAECTAATPGCHAGVRYALPPLQAGERYIAQIPLWADREAAAGDSRLDLQLKNAEDVVLDQKNTVLSVSAAQKPSITLLSAVSAKSQKPQVVRGRKTPVELQFRNDGQATAHHVAIAFAEPDGAMLEIEKDYKIPTWEPGQTHTFQIALTASLFQNRKDLILKIFLVGDNLGDLPTLQTVFDLVEDEQYSRAPEKLPAQVELEIQWDDDNDNMKRRSSQEKFEVHAQVTANAEVTLDNLVLLHTYDGGKDSIKLVGVKSDVVQFKKTNRSSLIHIYHFSHQVALKPGDNVLQVWAQKGAKRASTAPMTVRYTVNESTLYLISIGVPDETKNLKYTQKDARDIARLFAQQQGRLYGEVNTTVLTSKDSTRAGVIAGVLRNFGLLQRQNRLRPTDAILLFISSHGIRGDNGLFRLAASDYVKDNEKYTSLSFRDDILDALKGLGCHVFVLLDACHSGAAVGVKGVEDLPAEIIRDFQAAPKQVRLITSCSASESSYEDEAWQNSAFVKTLTTLLNDRTACKAMDVDQNKYLTIKELFERFPLETNNLVRQHRSGVTQSPYVPREILEESKAVPFWGY